MPERSDPLRHIFDGFAAMPAPTAEQVESARRSLSAAIGGNTPREPVRPKLRLGVVAAVVLALVVAFATIAPWGRTPAQALLAELAEATRSITPQELPAGSYVYVANEQLVYGDSAAPVDGEFVYVEFLLPSRVEAWWQDDTVQLETTVDAPIFFDSEMESFYYANDLDKADFVGQTRTDVFSGVSNQIDPEEWSDNPDDLATQLQESAEQDRADLPLEVRILELADQLLTPHRLASPTLRAAVLEVLATLDLDEMRLDGGRVSASITYDRRGFGTVTTEYVFDDQGYLIERRTTTLTGDDQGLIPAGTVFDSLTQTPPIIVPEPGIRPNEMGRDDANPPTVMDGAGLEVGLTYRYRFYIHCGMEWLIDFNDRTWVTEQPIYDGIGRYSDDLRRFFTNPDEQISPEMWVYLKLVAEDEIQLTLPDGSQESVYHPTDDEWPGCA